MSSCDPLLGACCSVSGSQRQPCFAQFVSSKIPDVSLFCAVVFVKSSRGDLVLLILGKPDITRGGIRPFFFDLRKAMIAIFFLSQIPDRGELVLRCFFVPEAAVFCDFRGDLILRCFFRPKYQR